MRQTIIWKIGHMKFLYGEGECMIKARGIKEPATLEIPLGELAVVSNDEIPLGAESAHCLNVIDGLAEVDWGGIAI